MDRRLKRNFLTSVGHKDKYVQLAALNLILSSGEELNLPETWEIIKPAFPFGCPNVQKAVIKAVAANSIASVDGMLYLGKLMGSVWADSVIQEYINAMLSIECKKETRQELVEIVFHLERYDLIYKVDELYSIHPEFVANHLLDMDYISSGYRTRLKVWSSVAKLCWADDKAFELIYRTMYNEYVVSRIIEESDKELRRAEMVRLLCYGEGRPCEAVEQFLMDVGINDSDCCKAASMALARLTMFSGDAVNVSVMRADELKSYASQIAIHVGSNYENVVDPYAFQDMLVSQCMILDSDGAFLYMEMLAEQEEIVLSPDVVLRAVIEYASNEIHKIFPLSLMVLGKVGLTNMIANAKCIVGDKYLVEYYEAMAESYKVRSKTE